MRHHLSKHKKLRAPMHQKTDSETTHHSTGETEKPRPCTSALRHGRASRSDTMYHCTSTWPCHPERGPVPVHFNMAMPIRASRRAFSGHPEDDRQNSRNSKKKSTTHVPMHLDMPTTSYQCTSVSKPRTTRKCLFKTSYQCTSMLT